MTSPPWSLLLFGKNLKGHSLTGEEDEKVHSNKAITITMCLTSSLLLPTAPGFFSLSCMGPTFSVSNSQCVLSNQNMFEEFHESAPENKTFVVLKKKWHI